MNRWLVAHVPGITPPLAFERIAGGRSNLTFTLVDARDQRWVLRRPPLHSTLPSAHDMGREHRIQAALAGTGVPVPRMIAHCADKEVVGTEFYVMEHVEGLVVRDRSTAEALGFPERRTGSMNLVDTLVRLHKVSPDDIGLGDLARKDGYISRQLRRWHRQWDAQKTRDLPLMERIHEELVTRAPEQAETRLVHGDYRLDNVVLSPAGGVRAVLDWELCTLGDPLVDLGMLLVYWADPGDHLFPLGETATVEPGFASKADLVDRYRAGTGSSADLDFYVAFACWRLGAILEGVYARHLAGAYGEPDSGVHQYRQAVELLAEEAQRVLSG